MQVNDRPVALVVDDSEDLRLLFLTALELEGYQAIGAADGAEALRRVSDSRPSVVLLDMNMPNVDGPQFLERMPKEVSPPLPQVIAMSADASFSRLAREHGAAEFLAKPLDVDILVDVIKSVLQGLPVKESLRVTNLSRITDKFSREDVERDRILDGAGLEAAAFHRMLRNLLRWLAEYFDTPMSFINLLRHDGLSLFENHGTAPNLATGTRMACEGTYCANLIRANESLVINDALYHAVYKSHPVTALGIRFYVSVPLRTPAHVSLGTLCIESTGTNAEFQPADLPALSYFADRIGHEIYLSSQGDQLRWSFFPDPVFLDKGCFSALLKARAWRLEKEPRDLSWASLRGASASIREPLIHALRALPSRAGVAFTEVNGAGIFSGFGPAATMDALIRPLDQGDLKVSRTRPPWEQQASG